MLRAMPALLLAAALAPAAASAQTVEQKRAALVTYADIAQAMYGDSLASARKLRAAVDALVKSPSERTMEAARTAWIASREPYQQTEVYRFGNAIVDEWEGQVNAWPLDEGLIDYVDAGKYGEASDENPWRTANVIANPELSIGGKTVHAKTLDWRLLRSLQEAGGVEANVAAGYHAIEFLLWGQDLNGTGPGAGARPWTDYAKGEACTNGHCDRRGRYLQVATQMLVDDLAWMSKLWRDDGQARTTLLENEDAGVTAMVTGLGSLSYGELAGERMKLGLMLHDPEEEHDCFSDNTHNSHYFDIQGMRAIYDGVYRRTGGAEVKGPGLSSLVAAASPELDREMKAKLAATHEAAATLKKRAESVERYDQMLAQGNAEGNAAVQAVIDRLTEQTKTLERAVAALKLDSVAFEGSDSLDAPEKVGQ